MACPRIPALRAAGAPASSSTVARVADWTAGRVRTFSIQASP